MNSFHLGSGRFSSGLPTLSQTFSSSEVVRRKSHTSGRPVQVFLAPIENLRSSVSYRRLIPLLGESSTLYFHNYNCHRLPLCLRAFSIAFRTNSSPSTNSHQQHVKLIFSLLSFLIVFSIFQKINSSKQKYFPLRKSLARKWWRYLLLSLSKMEMGNIRARMIFMPPRAIQNCQGRKTSKFQVWKASHFGERGGCVRWWRKTRDQSRLSNHFGNLWLRVNPSGLC